MVEEYETIIGLEVHSELKTKTKIFCSCSTEFGGEPNSHCCPVCMALPGAMPKLNEKVVEFAVKAGLATNCEITKYGWQDRKNYFYPDMPSGYQVSQTESFICQDGYIEIQTEEGNKKIRIKEMHIEEDSGKLSHGYNLSYLDLNRAGVPLIESVTEPDLRSAEEVDKYLKKLKSILQYIEVSDCKMEEGSLRADINISVRRAGETKLGNKVEVKNISSFRSITRAIKHEEERQINLLKEGKEIVSETMRWDEVEGRTIPMRDKDSLAYRPFPDPMLIPIVITEEYIEKIKGNLPELPESRRARYVKEYGLPEYDANIITNSKYLSNFFEDAEKVCRNAKAVSNWIMSDITRILNEKEIEPETIPFTAEQLGEMVVLIDKGTISSSAAKTVLEEMFETAKEPKVIIAEKGLVQVSDESAIKEVVMKILETNPQSIADFKAGRDRALGFLVGQAMKETKGKANPQMLNKIFLEELTNW